MILQRKRPDWSRPLPLPLPRPLAIPDVMTLKTLADGHKLMRRLPQDRCERTTWRMPHNLLRSSADPECAHSC